MLVHVRTGISKSGKSQCLRQASLCVYFSRCPGLVEHIEFRWLEIPRNYGNSSFVNNKSLQFLRIRYMPVIVLSFDY